MTRRELLALPAAQLLSRDLEPAVPDSRSEYGRVDAAEHQRVEGYFVLNEDVAIMARNGSEANRWFGTHLGQAVVLTMREGRRVK